MHLLPRFAIGALALGLAACSGSDSSSPSAAPGFDLLLTDAPADDLLALGSTVQSARLLRPDGSSTANLLSGPVQVDLLELDGLSKWLVSDSLAPGTYSGVALDFDPFGFQAIAANGGPVSVFAASSTLQLDFPAAVAVDDTSYLRVSADFDLSQSLDGDVGGGSLTIDPSGSASADSSGSDSAAIDEIKGRVVTVDAAASELVLAAFADGDLAVPLGDVTVEVSGSTVLVTDDGPLFTSAGAFFQSLVPNATLLEVHGDLVAGRLRADRIEVEDEFGAGGGSVAELRGLVVGLALPNSLELLIAEVEQGSSTVQAALGALGNPASVQVQLSPSTFVTLESEPFDLPASLDALAVGQEVEIKFSSFQSPPFPASRIEIEQQLPQYEGFVTDLSELPTALTMRLQASEPAVLSGQVAGPQTDVRVTLGGAPFFLKADNKPSLGTSDLQLGLKLEVEGTLTGTPSVPALDAARVGVFPGSLDDAFVSSLNPGLPGFSTIGGELDDPFGAGLTAGPLDVLIAPGAVFEGDAESAAEFFALSGDLEVEVEGLATGAPNQVRAWVIDCRIDD